MTDDVLQSEETENATAQAEISATAMAETVGGAVALISQRWLQTAVAVASAVKSGKPVNNGTFTDMRELREKYEELERARQVLNGMKQADKTAANSPADS